MTLTDSIFIVMAGFAGWLFWRQLAIREKALQYAVATCEKNDLQLLDQSVGLGGFQITKRRSGGWALERTYIFEFTSTGEQRYKGRLYLIGETLMRVQLDAFREPM